MSLRNKQKYSTQLINRARVRVACKTDIGSSSKESRETHLVNFSGPFLEYVKTTCLLPVKTHLLLLKSQKKRLEALRNYQTLYAELLEETYLELFTDPYFTDAKLTLITTIHVLLESCLERNIIPLGVGQEDLECTNSDFNQFQLEKRGKQMYNALIAARKGVVIKQEDTQELLAILAFGYGFVLAIGFKQPQDSLWFEQPEDSLRFEQPEDSLCFERPLDRLKFLSVYLEIKFSDTKPLALDLRGFEFDASKEWTYPLALAKALKLILADFSFFIAWTSSDPDKSATQANCQRIAEEILCVKLPPNALLAIKNHLDTISESDN